MQRNIGAFMKRLMVGILVMLLFSGTLPVFAYTEGVIETYEAVIPVVVEYPFDCKVKIEQLEGRTHLPAVTEKAPDADGTATFKMSFADAELGEIFKYRITEIPGKEKDVVYNIDEDSYICEVWIFYEDETGTGPVYARAFLYEADAPVDDPEALVDKPDECAFRNAKGPALVGGDDTSIDIVDQTQTGTLNFRKGTGEITDVYLINPLTGEKVRKGGGTIPAYENGKQVGTYEISEVIDNGDGTVTVRVKFVPNKGYVGSPDPAVVTVEDSNGLTATGRYFPHIYEGPTPINDETYGKKGQPQTGRPRFKEGTGKIVKIQFLDPYTGEPTDDKTIDALDQNGKKIGTYTLNDDGTVTFRPDPDFVGTPQPARLLGTDEHGLTAIAEYQPHVTDESSDSSQSSSGSTVKPKTPKGTSTTTGKTVKTGDDQRPLWFILLGTGAAVILFVMLRKRRRREE